MRKLDSLADSIADGLRGPDLQRRLDELGTRKKELGARLGARLEAPTPPPVRLHPNVAVLYCQKVAELHAALANPFCRRRR